MLHVRRCRPQAVTDFNETNVTPIALYAACMQLLIPTLTMVSLQEKIMMVWGFFATRGDSKKIRPSARPFSPKSKLNCRKCEIQSVR
jgi:hypothetical protein